jgi:hypothetical protein
MARALLEFGFDNGLAFLVGHDVFDVLLEFVDIGDLQISCQPKGIQRSACHVLRQHKRGADARPVGSPLRKKNGNVALLLLSDSISMPGFPLMTASTKGARS